MKAIQIQSKGSAAIVDLPKPSPPAGRVLVRTAAVALNPIDWKAVDFFDGLDGALVGSDFSGVVEAVGAGVSSLKKGDRIAGWTHGGNASNKAQDGSFAEYVLATEGIHLKIPESVTFEEAATLGMGITTVGQTLYQALKLPLPTQLAEQKFPVLVYGASTATGTLAVQFAKLSGLEVIAVCSPRNFALVQSLGADAVFDYSDPSVGALIRAHTSNALYHVLDCIAEGASFQICADALSSDTSARRPQYSALAYGTIPRDDIDVTVTVAFTTFGDAFEKPWGNSPASPEDFEFGKKFWALAERLLAEGRIRAHPPHVRQGLEGVFGGFDEMKTGKVSGKKLVYRVSEP